MAAAAAKGQGCGKPKSTTSCTPNALLIVEPHGGHVRECNRLEGADVHAGFHRGRNAQQVDAGCDLNFIGHEHLLEPPLPEAAINSVRLPRELLAVQPEGGVRASRKVFVVVRGYAVCRMRCRIRRQRLAACRTAACRRVQMRAPAARARVHTDIPGRVRSRTNNRERVGVDKPLPEASGEDSLYVSLEVVDRHPKPRGDLLQIRVDVLGWLPATLGISSCPSPLLGEHPDNARGDLFG